MVLQLMVITKRMKTNGLIADGLKQITSCSITLLYCFIPLNSNTDSKQMSSVLDCYSSYWVAHTFVMKSVCTIYRYFIINHIWIKLEAHFNCNLTFLNVFYFFIFFAVNKQLLAHHAPCLNAQLNIYIFK